MVEAKFVIHALEQQHESIRKLIAQTLDAPDNDHREMAFFELRKLLAVHETIEEMFVHPLARQKPKVGAGVVDGRQAEESEIKQHLQRIEGIDMGSAEFVARITELRSVVQEHTEHEEKEEFRGLRGHFFDADELTKIANVMRARNRIWPIDAPFAAMLDQARGAVPQTVS